MTNKYRIEITFVSNDRIEARVDARNKKDALKEATALREIGKFYLNKEDCYDLFMTVPCEYRRMTNQELAWWLRDCPEEHREWKYEDRSPHLVKSVYEYQDNMNADNKVKDNILVRRNGGAWEEPLIED